MSNFNFNKAIIGGRLTADPEELGIQTMTPDEVARLKAFWGE